MGGGGGWLLVLQCHLFAVSAIIIACYWFHCKFVYHTCTVPISAGLILIWPFRICTSTRRWSAIIPVFVFGTCTWVIGLSVGQYLGIDNRLSILQIFVSGVCSADISVSKVHVIYCLIRGILSIVICQSWSAYHKSIWNWRYQYHQHFTYWPSTSAYVFLLGQFAISMLYILTNRYKSRKS